MLFLEAREGNDRVPAPGRGLAQGPGRGEGRLVSRARRPRLGSISYPAAEVWHTAHKQLPCGHVLRVPGILWGHREVQALAGNLRRWYQSELRKSLRCQADPIHLGR